MTDDAAFIAAICAAPEDDLPRLVYADHLEEHGQPERAEFIRVQCEIARMEESGGPCEIDPNEGHTCVESPCPVCVSVAKYDALRERERELFEYGHTYRWGFPRAVPCTPFADDYAKGRGDGGPAGLIRRGFVHAVTCTAADWLAHGDKIAWRPGWTDECKCIKHLTAYTCGKCSMGRVPRPCPPTAQPIEVVRLTTGLGPLLLNAWASLAETGRVHHSELTIDFAMILLGNRWPGVRFELPVAEYRHADFSPLFTSTGQALTRWLDDPAR